MSDFRRLFGESKEYLGHWDLEQNGRVLTVQVTIERIDSKMIPVHGSEKKRAPILFFRGKRKGMILNVTNAIAIATLYGPDESTWIGKSIRLTVGQNKSPPKWIPVYGKSMPSLVVIGKSRNDQVLDRLQTPEPVAADERETWNESDIAPSDDPDQGP